MLGSARGEKLKVFISYSRRDSSDFAEELVAGLELTEFAPFLDRHDIAAGEDWEARLGSLIEQADTVVFVVSPEAVKSERCDWEVEKTVALSKRLLPVIFKPVPDTDIPEQLRRLQFVRFDTGPGLARPHSQLAGALRQDLDWIREHTRLGDLAARWQARNRSDSLLLRGDDLNAAKGWVIKRKANAPDISDLQRVFINASDEAETARANKERQQLVEMQAAQDERQKALDAAEAAQKEREAALKTTTRLQRRLFWGLVVGSILVLGVAVNALFTQYEATRREQAVYASPAASALRDERFDQAMRYALQAYPPRGSIPWLTPLSSELAGILAGGALSTHLSRVLRAHTSSVSSATFSPDGKRVVTASNDNTARIWDAESGQQTATLSGHTDAVYRVAFSPDGKRVVTMSVDGTVRAWNVAWAPLDHGATLFDRVCTEKLIGAAQEFTVTELEDRILPRIDRNDPIARNPCLRRGPLSVEYWTRMPGDFWRLVRTLPILN